MIEKQKIDPNKELKKHDIKRLLKSMNIRQKGKDFRKEFDVCIAVIFF